MLVPLAQSIAPAQALPTSFAVATVHAMKALSEPGRVLAAQATVGQRATLLALEWQCPAMVVAFAAALGPASAILTTRSATGLGTTVTCAQRYTLVPIAPLAAPPLIPATPAQAMAAAALTPFARVMHRLIRASGVVTTATLASPATTAHAASRSAQGGHVLCAPTTAGAATVSTGPARVVVTIAARMDIGLQPTAQRASQAGTASCATHDARSRKPMLCVATGRVSTATQAMGHASVAVASLPINLAVVFAPSARLAITAAPALRARLTTMLLAVVTELAVKASAATDRAAAVSVTAA